ncbi:acyl-CoA dehydrogenase family protein [Aquabacterium sp.]|mgnify:FL=1|jgi:acyl-CoA dehydrogenase|uniref:acyl-CoA dehydrogenase family protein n=1 Tax=Aquabacterium sp. TaxID=1872578 RepID=UPI001B4F17F6|nr:acyl-CoA dehydrogenase family protein [Aquabacterium sp.]MBP6612300.1 acyl-CoA dehydrogenase family protein [Aquabacterium sp.]MBP6614798.1 acyl-CoA dehydrogenase family protein [Aquabacterium sp.]MBP7502391.1 acyl-CoA dehydrogenase family protein [Aquabacterium sp.]MCC6219072.1 acyl-CoA dehydrogenase family protein [Aquabacterium sp.]MDD2977272.1 acyl-CoA dehydrogenase family protein [Aquabacterium sp.]
MDFQPSERAAQTAQRVRSFIDTHIAPIEAEHWAGILKRRHGGEWTEWQIPPRVEALKAQARAEGLWNLFLPDAELGAGLSVLDYAFSAEQTGRSMMAPEIFNCNAPDSGNMEVIWKYGNAEQKEKWLKPLLAGEIRSVFFMTEPDVASSDATNMAATAVIDGDHIVLNGKKWWSSGVGDPRCKIGIFMALTPDESKDRHHQHSMVLVPMDTPGVEIQRMLPVFGEYDEPHGHGEVHFHNVRVPIGNFISGPGRGFEIAQGRLGPGRIHHCMRCIGAAEKSLELAIQRGLERTAFRKPLIDLGGNRERIAECRVAIDQARLLTLQAAWKIDTLGVMSALTDVSAIKVVAPSMLQHVVDFAIQIHGGAGVSHDTPLTMFFNQARSLRLADGPDEVHKGMIARLELMKYGVKR